MSCFDKHGRQLAPFDLVSIGSSAPCCAGRKFYGYGMIKYAAKNDPDGQMRWHENTEICVRVAAEDRDRLAFFNVMIEADSLEKIPENIIVRSFFLNFDSYQDSENSHFQSGVVEEMAWPPYQGTQSEDYVRKILRMPYQQLVSVHERIVTALGFDSAAFDLEAPGRTEQPES